VQYKNPCQRLTAINKTKLACFQLMHFKINHDGPVAGGEQFDSAIRKQFWMFLSRFFLYLTGKIHDNYWAQ
jgi:hypothetical protein